MNFIKPIFLILCFYSLNFAQQDFVNIWQGPVPGTEDKTNNEKITDVSIINVFQPGIKVFLPEKSNSNHPAILIFPGGGYKQIVVDKEGYKIAEWLNENGIAAFVLKYRLKPEDAFNDGQRAVSFIRSKAEGYNIDPNKVGVIGFSAGGHLAANISTHKDKNIMNDRIDSVSSVPDFMISVYGAVSRSISDVSGKTPPTFLVCTSDDEKVPAEQSVNYYLALKKNGVPAELHVYEKGLHGFALLKDKGYVSTWADRCIDWMKGRGLLAK
jgi:acetyl esterase/lipase